VTKKTYSGAEQLDKLYSEKFIQNSLGMQ